MTDDPGSGGWMQLKFLDTDGRGITFTAELYHRDAGWLRDIIDQITVAMAEGRSTTLDIPIHRPAARLAAGMSPFGSYG